MGPYEEIHRRIRTLDDAPMAMPDESKPENALRRLVFLMGGVTNGYIAGTYDMSPVLDPRNADELVKSCSTLALLAAAQPNIVSGELDIQKQAWIVTSRSDQIVQAATQRVSPSREQFSKLATTERPVTKPQKGGLFTSTMLQNPESSMWQLYLELYGGDLFPMPWYTYHLEIDETARVYEVDSATKWAELVQNYPLRKNELLYPDWPIIASQYDAIHMTVAAIVAMQGLRLNTLGGVVAETYWDVESTLWLNWVFESATLLP